MHVLCRETRCVVFRGAHRIGRVTLANIKCDITVSHGILDAGGQLVLLIFTDTESTLTAQALGPEASNGSSIRISVRNQEPETKDGLG